MAVGARAARIHDRLAAAATVEDIEHFLPLSWTSPRNEAVGALRRAGRNGHLQLVVGAGVSMGSRLPSWDDLIRAAAVAALSQSGGRRLDRVGRRTGMSTLALVSVIRSAAATETAFLSSLAHSLYAKAASIGKNRTLKEVAILLGRQAKAQSGKALCLTYNFDDLLELALGRWLAKGGTQSILCAGDNRNWLERRIASIDVGIAHLHGFLPRPPLTDQTSAAVDLVFSEKSYHEQSSSGLSWAGLCQLGAFTRSSCLFLGFSFRDPNVRRLLYQSRDLLRNKSSSGHFTVRESSVLKKGRDFSQADRMSDYLAYADLRLMGVEPIWVANYSTDLPRLLASVK